MRYKPGQMIAIRQDLKLTRMGATVTPIMLQYAGATFVVKNVEKIRGGGGYYCDVYEVEEIDYVWDDTAIDHEATEKLNLEFPTIKDSGNRSEFPTGAVRDLSHGKGRMDLLPWHGIIEVSKHCEEGAKKYGENNVDKGIPLHSLIDSAFRHLAKFTAGHKDEDHLRAAAWNILWALEFRETMPELNDLYNWREKNESN